MYVVIKPENVCVCISFNRLAAKRYRNTHKLTFLAKGDTVKVVLSVSQCLLVLVKVYKVNIKLKI